MLLRHKGKNMSLEGLGSTRMRVLLDGAPPCVETHASAFECTWLGSGTSRLLCR